MLAVLSNSRALLVFRPVVRKLPATPSEPANVFVAISRRDGSKARRYCIFALLPHFRVSPARCTYGVLLICTGSVVALFDPLLDSWWVDSILPFSACLSHNLHHFSPADTMLNRSDSTLLPPFSPYQTVACGCTSSILRTSTHSPPSAQEDVNSQRVLRCSACLHRLPPQAMYHPIYQGNSTCQLQTSGVALVFICRQRPHNM